MHENVCGGAGSGRPQWVAPTEASTPRAEVGPWEAWIAAARPKTLSGAAVPVMIGLSLAYQDLRADEAQEFQAVPALLCLLFAFLMQIDANLVNDLFDFLRGRDKPGERLGPRRATAEGWISPRRMKWAIAAVSLLASIVGLPLVIYGGAEMVLIGLAVVVFCFLYTTHLASRGMGDLLVVVFFGIVPVGATYYIQTGEWNFLVGWTSVACGLVIDALLVVNNFRDRDGDKRAGKKTLVVRLGERLSLGLYQGLGYAAALMGAVFLCYDRPLAFLLPMVYLMLHLLAYQKMKRIRKGKALNIVLAETARNIFIYGLTLSIGILM